MTNKSRIIITPSEPAGIRADLVAMLAQQAWPVELVICADPTLLNARKKQICLPLYLHAYQPDQPETPRPPGELTVLSISAPKEAIPGVLNTVNNSRYIIQTTLARACNGCLNGEFKALLTGPVHKEIINESGFPFTGHTEFFAKRSQKNEWS